MVKKKFSRRKTSKKRKTIKKQKGGNKLKIALVFSGQPRFVSGPSYESIKSNLLDKYDCDVYAHFWISNSKGNGFLDNTNPNINKINKNIDDFKRLYKPIDIQIDTPIDKDTLIKPLMNIDAFKFIENNNELYNTIFKNISRAISQKKAFSLIKNANNYDFIISLRTDLFINVILDLNILLKDKIYSPLRNDKFKYIDYANIFASKYAHYYFNLIDIFNNIYIKYGNGNYMGPEEVMYHLFEYYNILQYCEDIPIEQFNFKIVRENSALE
jgi:hypothetical protein